MLITHSVSFDITSQCGIPTFTGGTCSLDVKIKNENSNKWVLNFRQKARIKFDFGADLDPLFKFLYKYIFHYKYVASAVIYFECGWRIPKSVRNGKKSDGDGGAARYLCTVKSEKFKFKWSVKCYEVKWWSCYQFWYDDFLFLIKYVIYSHNYFGRAGNLSYPSC